MGTPIRVLLKLPSCCPPSMSSSDPLPLTTQPLPSLQPQPPCNQPHRGHIHLLKPSLSQSLPPPAPHLGLQG